MTVISGEKIYPRDFRDAKNPVVPDGDTRDADVYVVPGDSRDHRIVNVRWVPGVTREQRDHMVNPS